MNRLNKWVCTIIGIAAFGAALASGSAKANCNTAESVHATTPNYPFPAADYCAGGGNFAYLNYEAIYYPSAGYAANYATQYSTSNRAGYQLSTEVHCSDGRYYYSTPVYQGPYYAAGAAALAYCPYGTYPLDSWAFGYIPNP